MTNLLIGNPPASGRAVRCWSLARLLRALLGARREIRKISVLARRERLQRGYRHVPQRLWDRHSALFVER
jgi:hypothetical protein